MEILQSCTKSSMSCCPLQLEIFIPSLCMGGYVSGEIPASNFFGRISVCKDNRVMTQWLIFTKEVIGRRITKSNALTVGRPWGDIFPQILIPDSKVHGANLGPICGRQDPGGPDVGPMNFAIWFALYYRIANTLELRLSCTKPSISDLNSQLLIHNGISSVVTDDNRGALGPG